MGNYIHKFLYPNQARILLLGLEDAGKTTLLYQLKMGLRVDTVPTRGFNVEAVSHKNITFITWDVGGQDSVRHTWQHYFKGTHAVVFVVDSADHERMAQAKKELDALLQADELSGAALLVFANKQDDSQALSVAEVTRQLGLTEMATSGRQVHCEGSVATTGVGLEQGMTWLAETLGPQLG